jgi:hypothetical protein
MLAAYKADAKKGGVAFSRPRKSTGRLCSTPDGHFNADQVSKHEQPHVGSSVSSLLAQPSWATHLQSKIAVVAEPWQQQQLREAMLQFSALNANYKLDFLRPQDCRFVPDPFFCTIGRCSMPLHLLQKCILQTQCAAAS